jgi:ribose transport system permease protein
MTATPVIQQGRGDVARSVAADVRRNGWFLALLLLLGALLVAARLIRTDYGASDIQSLATAVLPLAFAAAAQTVIVLGGGIDLSIGGMMAFTNVMAAVLMQGRSDEVSAGVVVGVLVLGAACGLLNGVLVVVTRVPDIIVTLAMEFVWAGAALLVLNTPGGAAPEWLKSLSVGSWASEWLPRALVVLAVGIGLVWIPLRRSRLGLSIFAIGSDRVAALRSGVDVPRTRIATYAIGGLLAAMGGLALTMNTGIGTPTPGPYTLNSIAAIVLGGVSLAGGRGGMLGPVLATFILALIRYNLFFLGVDPNYSTVIQGVVLVVVVMVGGLVSMRRGRAGG